VTLDGQKSSPILSFSPKGLLLADMSGQGGERVNARCKDEYVLSFLLPFLRLTSPPLNFMSAENMMACDGIEHFATNGCSGTSSSGSARVSRTSRERNPSSAPEPPKAGVNSVCAPSVPPSAPTATMISFKTLFFQPSRRRCFQVCCVISPGIPLCLASQPSPRETTTCFNGHICYCNISFRGRPTESNC